MRPLATQLIRHLTDPRTDGELLAGFLASGCEPDFAELVRRHGPLVWGVCRRSLPVQADAEDAFQAVFVVLLRKARGLTASATVGPWLYRVATWTARSIRRRNARRNAKHTALPDQLPATSPDADLPLDLDAALLSLPEKYRSPVVLCHLMGYSRADAAQKLGCPEGTLSAWLSRGLAKLRTKLTGFDPAKVLGGAAVAVPAALSTSAVRAGVASHVASASAVAVSSTVSQLAEGVLHMFWVKKATAASFALFTVFAMGVGVGLSGRTVVTDANAQDRPGDGKAVKIADKPTAQAPKDVRILIDQLAAAQKEHDLAVQAARLIVEKMDLDPKGAQVNPEALAEAQKRVNVTALRLKKLSDELAALKASDAADQPHPLRTRKVRELEDRIAEAERFASVADEFAKLQFANLNDLQNANAKPAIIKEAESQLAKAILRADDARVLADKLKDELAALKRQMAPPAAGDDRAKKVRELEDRIVIAEAACDTASSQADLRKAELLSLKKTGAKPAQLAEAEQLLIGAARKAEDAAQHVMKLRDDLAALKQSAAPKAVLQPAPDVLKDIDRQLTDLKSQYELLMLERNQLVQDVKNADAKAQEIERRTKAVADAAKTLEAKRAEIAKSVVVAKPGGYLELRVYGKEGWFEFSVKEVGADGKGVGTAIIREPEMLAKFLARTRTDATAPQELRVVVEPTGSLTTHPRTALKACDAAGYRTVKFTGYVFGGGYAPPLKADQKGNVPGYKHYENAERSPAQLIKEIEEGLSKD